MSAGYNDPGFGLPDTGGSFIGLGRMTAACNIPNEIQPAVPPGGLFGPDAFIPSWGFPGYKSAPDIAHPQLPIMPSTRPIEGPFGGAGMSLAWNPGDEFDFIKESEWNLPGKPPSSYPGLTFQGGGSAVGRGRPSYEMMGASAGEGASGSGGGVMPWLIYGAITAGLAVAKALSKKSSGNGESKEKAGGGPADTLYSFVSKIGSVITEVNNLTDFVSNLIWGHKPKGILKCGSEEDWATIRESTDEATFNEFINKIVPWIEKTYLLSYNDPSVASIGFCQYHCRNWAENVINSWRFQQKGEIPEGWNAEVYYEDSAFLEHYYVMLSKSDFKIAVDYQKAHSKGPLVSHGLKELPSLWARDIRSGSLPRGKRLDINEFLKNVLTD